MAHFPLSQFVKWEHLILGEVETVLEKSIVPGQPRGVSIFTLHLSRLYHLATDIPYDHEQGMFIVNIADAAFRIDLPSNEVYMADIVNNLTLNNIYLRGQTVEVHSREAEAHNRSRGGSHILRLSLKDILSLAVSWDMVRLLLLLLHVLCILSVMDEKWLSKQVQSGRPYLDNNNQICGHCGSDEASILCCSMGFPLFNTYEQKQKSQLNCYSYHVTIFRVC